MLTVKKHEQEFLNKIALSEMSVISGLKLFAQENTFLKVFQAAVVWAIYKHASERVDAVATKDFVVKSIKRKHLVEQRALNQLLLFPPDTKRLKYLLFCCMRIHFLGSRFAATFS